MSIIRAAARRAATIFQPLMLPERSITNTTSRGLPASVSVLGGTSVSMNVPVFAVGVVAAHQRRGELGAVEPPAQDEVAIEPLAGLDLDDLRIGVEVVTACRLDTSSRIAPSCDRDAQREPHRIRHARQTHRRRDPRGIGDQVGVRDGAEAGLIAAERRCRACSAARRRAGTGT